MKQEQVGGEHEVAGIGFELVPAHISTHPSFLSSSHPISLFLVLHSADHIPPAQGTGTNQTIAREPMPQRYKDIEHSNHERHSKSAGEGGVEEVERVMGEGKNNDRRD